MALDEMRPSKGIASVWFTHTDDSNEEVRRDLADGKAALDRLAKIIEAEYASCVNSELNIEAPEFAVRAAYLYGQKAALTKLYRIVTGDPSTKKE